MGFLVSPGVDVNEIDLTNVIPAVSTSIGGYAGPFRWGPVEEIELVSSEKELASAFGTPDAFYAESFFTASSFLKYGNALKVVRTSNSQLLNAVSGSINTNIGGIDSVTVNNPLAVGLTSDATIVVTGDQRGTVLSGQYTIDSAIVNNEGSDFANGELVEGETVSVDLGNNNSAILTIGAFGIDEVDTIVNTALSGATEANYIDVAQTSSNGSGTGATFNVTIDANSAATAVTVTSPGSGYIIGETITINGSEFGGSGTLTFDVASFGTIPLTATTNPSLSGVPASVTGLATEAQQASNLDINDLTVDLTFALTGVVATNPGAGHTLSDTTLTVNGTEVAAAGNYSFVEFQGTFSNAILIKNETQFENGILAQGALYARYAGALGNSIQVDVFDTAGFNAGQVKTNGISANPLTDLFDGAPDSDEYHIVVTDVDGALTGTAGTVLETWPFLGKNDGAKKEDGSNNFYQDVINENSEFFYVTGAISVGTNGFGDGADQTTVIAGDIKNGIDVFADTETVDVNLVFAYNDDNGSDTIAEHLIQVANARKDIVVFTSPPIEDSLGNSPLEDVKEWCNGITSTSYAVLDSSAIYTYNKFADKYLYIPACGHVAGLCANTDDVAEPWFSPAGFNRGQLLGITKLAYNPKQADRDELYKARINPIVSFPGQGTLLFGDKTAQSKPSAFDRINVRRLFIVLEKAISTAAKFQLFELNDEFTRSMFRNMTEPFLRDVKGRRGVTDFLVVCDETNNTGQVIDTNRFVADIYIKPSRSINFITLNFIATRTGVEFSEIVGS